MTHMMNDDEQSLLGSSSENESSSNDADFHIKSSVTQENTHHWNDKQRTTWLFTLIFGSAAFQASRLTMPLVAPACSEQMHWSKIEVGTVLSSFFWGYSMTQILGGYLSDR